MMYSANRSAAIAFVRNCGNTDIEGVAKLEVYKPVTGGLRERWLKPRHKTRDFSHLPTSSSEYPGAPPKCRDMLP